MTDRRSKTLSCTVRGPSNGWRRWLLICGLCATPFILAGCTGLIEEPGASEDGPSLNDPGDGPIVDGPMVDAPGKLPPGIEPPPDPETIDCLTTLDMGPSSLRRLTRVEYDNSIRDLLGDDRRLASSTFAEDEKVGGFDSNAIAPVSQLGVEEYQAVAADIAARAVAEQLDTLVPCDPAIETELACVERFVTTFGRRAWRRPLTPAEVARVTGVYQSMRDGGVDHADGVRVALQVMLQSPSFLYHIEVGQPVAGHDDIVKLTGYELASRLSYFLWGSTPDDRLLDAAAAGFLDSPAGLEAQARRMLADDKARETIVEFHHQWLELDHFDAVHKVPDLYPAFDDALRADMLTETELFVERVIFEEDGTLYDLLGASHSYLNARLAAHYGVEAPTDDGFHRIELDPAQRTGLLTHASLLSIHAKPDQSSPVHRGMFVRERLLCQTIPEPPPGIDITPPPFDPTLSTRDRFRQHREDEACSGCHNLMDPIGFGFENYDAIGVYREMDGEFVVDASGEFFQTLDLNGTFDGVVEMSEQLTDSEQVRQCVAEQWLQFALKRTAGSQDYCSFQEAYETFGESGLSIQEFMVAITTTDAFGHRRVPAPTVTTEEMP